jgi:hypothetical protein
MKEKNNNNFTSFDNETSRDSVGGIKQILNKNDCELFDDAYNVASEIISVKRVASSKDEKWKIYKDAKVSFVLEGLKLTEKERAFLRTPSGVCFLIKQYKSGIKSFNDLRKKIKQNIKPDS